MIDVPQGNEFLGPLTDGHATTMFLLWGLSAEEIESLVEEVARLQLMQWDFKPLFVTDSDHWDAFQEHSYWFEYVPPAEDWISHNSGGDWSQFVSERIDSIIETYSPDRIVVYEDADKRGALKRGVLNGVISAGEPVVEMTTTAKLQPPARSPPPRARPRTAPGRSSSRRRQARAPSPSAPWDRSRAAAPSSAAARRRAAKARAPGEPPWSSRARARARPTQAAAGRG